MKTTNEKAITEAEIFAAAVVQIKLAEYGIPVDSPDRTAITTRAAELLVRHREEVRDMYIRGKDILREWIIKETHIENIKAFMDMRAAGFTGNILEDMKRI